MAWGPEAACTPVMSEQGMSGYGDEMGDWTAACFAASLAKDLDPVGDAEPL